VGRFVEQKNHEFLVQIAEVLSARDLRVRFLLVGGGHVQRRIERSIHQRGLEDRFVILPPRDDVHRLMLGAMDFFLFPSHHEGLPLALLEAQAAGLRCFASTAVPTEAVAVPSLVHRLPLSAGPEFWAETILQQIGVPCPVTREEALRRLEDSFDIRQNAAKLVEFYLAAAS
jgi:glycosyltransferase involved in cell wall biosynthesis